MLQKMSESIGRWIAGGILGLIAITFIFFGINFTAKVPDYAAKVNGDKIPLTDFQRELQIQESQYQQVYHTDLTEQVRNRIRRNVINRLVGVQALQQRVDSEGYYISDARLADYLRSVAAFQVDGKFSPQAYQSALATQGMTPTGFEGLERQQLALDDLQNGLTNSAFYTPAEFRRYIELNAERRKIAFATFPVDSFLPEAKVTDTAVKSYYDSNKPQFMTPESVDLQYIDLTQADVAATVEVTDADLHEYYEQNKDKFQTPEERRAQHILISIKDDTKVKEAQDKAQMVLQKLQAGGDFAKLAKEYSDDAGSKNSGGDLGWISRGMLKGAFEDALFSIKKAGGVYPQPVETKDGFHIIRLEAIRPGTVQPFDKIKDTLRKDYQSEQAQDEFADKANALADATFDAYNELDGVAKKMGLTVKTLKDFTRDGAPQTFSNSAPIVKAAFDPGMVDSGKNSQLIKLSDTEVVVLRDTAHHKPMQQAFDQVKDKIEKQLERTAAEHLADEAAAAFEKAVDGGAKPADAAKAQGGKWAEPAWHHRNDNNVPGQLLSTAFGMSTPADDKPVRERVPLPNGDRAVLFVDAVEPGKPEDVPSDQRDKVLEQLAQQTGQQDMAAYAADVQNKAKVEIPDNVLNVQQ
jgi:peptidyl-prolyl cis-trans isomerase D